MLADRYLKIILTVIALELGWIAVKDATVNVSAQQPPAAQAAPTPVVIRGIDLPGEDALPVTLVRSLSTLRVADQLIRIRADQPIVVETRDRPLLIQSVPASAAPRPGPGQ
jgi:hypothetical protein